MKKIETLTPEQVAKFPEYVEKWLSIGRCTDPADRPRAEAAIRAMYEGSKLKQPAIIWCESPLSMVLSRGMVDSVRASVGDSVRASVGDSVRASVRDSVWASVRDSVGDSVRASVGASVGDSVGASVGDSVRASVRDSVWASVGDSVGASVRDSVRASVWASVRDSVYGQHEASWLSFYDFFHHECALTEETEALQGLNDLSQSCGWILPLENVCFASERHYICATDEGGLIHHETGPAVAYRDGFEIYAWHGTRVPKEWITEKDSLDPAEVIKHENVEMRAVGASIIGWAKMAEKLERRIIDGDPQTDLGALVELTLPGLPDPGRFLMAQCPRNGTICEGVPRHSDIDGKPIDTVIAAQAWRDCLPADEYIHPTIRT